MVSQDKLIKQGIKYTDTLFNEIENRLKRGVLTSDTLESFLIKTKDYTISNPLVMTGFKDKLLSLILSETNNHKFSRPSQKELTRITIEERVGEKIVEVGADIKNSVRDIVKDGYNNNLSQDEIAENISKKINTIKNKRARAIARTEIARTATVSDYVINKERGATHFTVECRNTACPYCKEKVLTNPEIIPSGKGIQGDVEYSIVDTGNLPPYHPNCRCVAYFYKKEYFEDLQDYNSINSLKSPFPTKPKGEFKSLSVNMERSKIMERITGFVDSDDLNTILDLLDEFRIGVKNVGWEWCIGQSIMGFIEGIYTDEKEDEVLLTDKLMEEGSSKGLLTVIHNHIYDTVPFPSPEDFETFVTYKVKYGIVSNEFGIFIVKNNNYDVDLTPEESKKIIKTSISIKKKMEEDFQKLNPEYEGIVYDDKDDEYYTKINNYVKQHCKEYVELYQDCLSGQGIDIMFIKTNNHK